MPNRPAIPADVQRQVLTEAGHRCAVCGESCPLEKAHIIPWHKSKQHPAEDLICFCANCHGRADTEHWDEKTFRWYKESPWVLRRRDAAPAPVAPAGANASSPNSTVVNGDANGAFIVPGSHNTFINGDLIQQVAESPALHPLHQLPPPPADFTGREAELGELLSCVEVGGATISGVRGMGGIGKTALALVIANKLRDRYPDAQFYLDLKGTTEPLSAAQAMTHVIRAYHPTNKLPETEAELAPLYLSVLDSKRVLLLMDNAREAAQVKALVPPPGCCLLVTSRWQFTLRGWHTIELGALPPADARNLLLRAAPRIAGSAHEIARLCGRLPLALCLAGGALSVRADMLVEEYIQRLRDSRTRLRELDEYRDCTEEELGVEASLHLSYTLLGPKLQQLWRALAVFPVSFNTLAAAAVWRIEAEEARNRLGDLRQHSIVEWTAECDRYSLHDLSRDFASSKLDNWERRTAEQRHAEFYLISLSVFNDLYHEGGHNIKSALRAFDIDRANIETGQRWAAEHASEDESAARLCSLYPTLGSYCLGLRQHPRTESMPWLEAGLAAARRLEDRKAEAFHLGHLGTAFLELGETQRAVELYQQELAIAREIGNRGAESACLGNIGLACLDLGKPQKAIEYCTRALTITRELGDRRGEAYSFGSLGNAHVVLGELRQALELYEKQLAITRETGDRRYEGTALGNIGVVYDKLGEPRRAIEYYEKLLVIAREIGDRRGESTALWNLALAWKALHERSKAITLAEQSLVIREQIEHPDAPKTRRSLERWRAAGDGTPGS